MKFVNYNGVLSELGFKVGIEILSTYYTTFRFWQEDFKGQIELRKSLWYEVFSEMNDDLFKNVIESYCRKNIYAPQSPTHLLEHIENELKNKVPKAESEYLKVKEIIKKHRGFMGDVSDEIEKIGGVIFETFKIVKPLLKGSYIDIFNEPKARDEFIRVYNEMMNQSFNKSTAIKKLLENKMLLEIKK